MTARPVLLVRGIGETGSRLEPLAKTLRADCRLVEIFRYEKRFGQVSLETLAEQLAAVVERISGDVQDGKIDLVGFSMGALISRTYIQCLGGRDRIGRFISISGPQRGTWTAYLVPGRLFDLPGCVEMRPKSDLLKRLECDPDPWGEVEVHTIRSTLDHMIVPATSSHLPRERYGSCTLPPLIGWALKRRFGPAGSDRARTDKPSLTPASKIS